MDSLNNDTKLMILSFVNIDDVISNNILLTKYTFNNLSNKNKYRYLIFLIEKNLKVFLDFFNIKFLIENKDNIFFRCIFNMIVYKSPLYFVKYFVDIIFPTFISNLNIENELINFQYISFYKEIMNDACKANRFDIVKYMYNKTNKIYSSNIRCSNYESEIYYFLIENCKFVQYKNLSND